MGAATEAERALRDGDPAQALRLLQDAVRANASDSELRVFLFQLLALTGQWERAMTQLTLCGELDPAALPMVQTYREAIQCEALRAEVFEGKRSPLVLGQPEPWMAFLVEALSASAAGNAAQARSLRDKAMEEAPASSGAVGDRPFEWIADADMRLGPVLEAIVNGRYYWVPFTRLSHVVVEAPVDLRDMIWMPATLTYDNGGESVALIPSRYPKSQASTDPAVVMGRKTVWEETEPGFFQGLGQRVLTTDDGEYALLDVRDIRLGEQPPEQ